MARSSDPKKAALWQRRFRRFHDSGLPVARFCGAERLSEASFYYWQKKLGPPKLRPRKLGRQKRGRAVGAENGAASRGDWHAVTDDQRVFRPVTVVSTDGPATRGVIVRLPGGTRIDVDAEHLDVIRAVVAETVRTDHDLTSVRGPWANVPGRGRCFPSDNHLIRTNDEAVSC